MCKSSLLLVFTVCAVAQEMPTFGTTVSATSGLQGNLYLLKPGRMELPSFKGLRPVGAVYTTSLQIAPRPFNDGFPGITDRFEWFALDYTGRFWVDQPGVYRFRLLSDDGSKLYINGKLLIDNDGVHAPQTIEGAAEFSRGVYRLRLSYFQGPRQYVALVLSVLKPAAANWSIFDTNDFKPPADLSEWLPGALRNIKRGSTF